LFSRKHTQRKLLVLHFALLVERRRVWSATVACFHSRLNGNFIALLFDFTAKLPEGGRYTEEEVKEEKAEKGKAPCA